MSGPELAPPPGLESPEEGVGPPLLAGKGWAADVLGQIKEAAQESWNREADFN